MIDDVVDVQDNDIHVCKNSCPDSVDLVDETVVSRPSKLHDEYLDYDNEVVKSVSDGESAFSDVDIVINRVRAVTMRVPVVTNGIEVNAVVDTGAEVTVINEAKLFIVRRVGIQFFVRLRDIGLFAEAGRKMVTLGVADIDVKIGSLKSEWPIYIAPV